MNGQEDNPLLPEEPAAPGGMHPLVSAMHGAHDAAADIYRKTSESLRKLDATRVELTKLGNQGPDVKAEDVIESAGKLVAVGIRPVELAGLLADMPETGPAIAQWLQDHIGKLAQVEKQASLANTLSRHEMGVSALRALAGHGALMPTGQSPSGPTVPDGSLPANPLAPGVEASFLAN